MSERPVTSKSRGICKYYQTPRGCFAGESCKFSHGEPYTPFDLSKSCKFFAAGYCSRGSTCWFKHVQPESQVSSGTTARACPAQTVTPDPSNTDDDHVCCICMEKPVTFGLLAGCSHIFCIECIREWRGSKEKNDDVVDSGVTKKCPLCRVESRFVTPSSHFYAQGDPAKDDTISRYKDSMSRIDCKYFQKSSADRFCPFGNECFYKHQNEDGTNYEFPHGASHYLEVLRRRRTRTRWLPHGRGLFLDDGDWAGFGEDDDDDDASLSPEAYLDDDLGAVLDAISFRMLRGNTENSGMQQETDNIPAGFASNMTNGRSSSGDLMQETTRQGLFTRLATLHLDDSSFRIPTLEDWNSEFDGTMHLYQFGSIVPSQIAVPSTFPELGETVSELEPTVQILRPNTHSLRISSSSPHLSSISPLGVSTPIEGPPRFSTVVQHHYHSTMGMNDNNQASNPTIVDIPSGPGRPIPCEDDRVIPHILSNDDSMDRYAHTSAEEPTAGPSNLDPSPETISVINSSPIPDLQTPGSDPTDPFEADRQEIDPPVLTDGRGRVVWSSTAAIRGRKGRGGSLLTPQRTRRRESSPTSLPIQEVTNLPMPGE